MKKISFLMAAHNEEKLIAKPLENLINLPYKNYEVLVGLDGCTDNTEKIVKSFEKCSSKFKSFKLNLREGKAAVVNYLIKKAKGEIVIVHDADWIFKVKDASSINRLARAFEKNSVGGIAESFPIEWHSEGFRKGNWVYKMIAYSSYYWIAFQKEKYSRPHKGYATVLKPTMFLTNIFLKKFYRPNLTLGDDIERTKNVMDSGSKVILFTDLEAPRMITEFYHPKLSDLFRQKIRTAIARDQIKDSADLSFFNYYIPAILYLLRNSWKSGFQAGLLVFFWVILNSVAITFSKFKSRDTREGWKLRVKR